MTAPVHNDPYGKRARPAIKWPKDAKGAKQGFRKECDINFIVARHMKTGVMPLPQGEPRYLDTVGLTDFQELQNLRAAVETRFEEQPEEVRQEFSSASEWLEHAIAEGLPEVEDLEAPEDSLEPLGDDSDEDEPEEPAQLPS